MFTPISLASCNCCAKALSEDTPGSEPVPAPCPDSRCAPATVFATSPTAAWAPPTS